MNAAKPASLVQWPGATRCSLSVSCSMLATAHLLARRLHEMKSADARVELLIDLRCGSENFLDARVRAAHHYRQALRGSHCERQLVHLPCSRFVRPGGQHEEAGKDSVVLVTIWKLPRCQGVPLRRPSGPCHRSSAYPRHRRVARKELLRRSASEKGRFLRRIDRDFRVGGNTTSSPSCDRHGDGDHYGVETRQVHSELLDVARICPHRCQYRRGSGVHRTR